MIIAQSRKVSEDVAYVLSFILLDPCHFFEDEDAVIIDCVVEELIHQYGVNSLLGFEGLLQVLKALDSSILGKVWGALGDDPADTVE